MLLNSAGSERQNLFMSSESAHANANRASNRVSGDIHMAIDNLTGSNGNSMLSGG